MNWNSIPNFDDENSRIKERTHNISGAKIIEVLYGARDSSGNPTSPENKDDGHGHWIALEIDGTYQMLSWRLPRHEGGRQEYGKNRRDNVLADMEKDIEDKKNLCEKAEALDADKDFKQGSQEMAALMEVWKGLFNWNTPKEKELWTRFRSAQDKFYIGRDNQREKNASAKRAIIVEANSIAHSDKWKQTGDALEALFRKWKAIASAGKDEDERLWNEFNRARQTFYDRRKKHYDKLSEQRDNNRRQKNELIQEARNKAQYSEQWKQTGDELHALMDRWKAVGSAGREHDDKLWEEFNSIRQDFFNRRKHYYKEQDQKYLRNAEAKGGIVTEATNIANTRDYSKAHTERMKMLDKEWKAIGSAGRDQEQRLWQIFQAAKDSFWPAKRADAERKKQEFHDKLNDAIIRKRSQIANLQNQISDLRVKMSSMRNQEYINNMYQWIDEKESKIRELEYSISDMQSKL